MTEVNVISPSSVNSGFVDQTQRSRVSDDSNNLKESQLAQQIERKERDLREVESLESVGQSKRALNHSDEEVTDKRQQLGRQMEDLNSQLQQLRNYLRFEKDENTEKMVIFIKNSETDEIIRQIPSEEFLAISKNITQFLEMRQELSEKVVMPKGLLTNETA